MEIPHTVEPREDTGLYNGRLAIWLFLASEAMLFGALFSAYALLRSGSESWPRGADLLDVPVAAVNTVVLVLSSITMLGAWAALREGNLERSRRSLWSTVGLGFLFVVLKGYEWVTKIGHGFVPARGIFESLYFTLTGVHLLHVVAGLVVLAYLVGPGSALFASDPRRFANRVEVTGIYWHFVDVVWLILFPLLYLT